RKLYQRFVCCRHIVRGRNATRRRRTGVGGRGSTVFRGSRAMEEWQALVREGRTARPTGTRSRRAPEPPPPPPDPVWDEAPRVPRSIDETGIPEGYITDLILKTLSLRGTLLGHEICSELKLP